MPQYAIHTSELRRILHLVSEVMDVRTTFFDMEGHELGRLDVKDMSPFCRELRRSENLESACHRCDREHLLKARESGEPSVYRCHAGLLEAMVPLHDRQRRYLGALVLGQVRAPHARPHRSIPRRYHALFRALPEASEKRVRQMAELLRLVSEAIIENELVRLHRPHWADALRDYIEAHLSESLSIEQLADVIERSPSFVSHHFRQVFGDAPMQYVRRRRLERSRSLLKSGISVGATALELGFCDAFHFSKAFREAYGMPPSRFMITEVAN